MNEKTNKGTLVLRMILVLLMIFMATMNVINRYYYFIFIAFILFAAKSNRKFRLDGATVALLVLAISWMAFSPTSTASVLGIVKPFTYVLCYVMGSSMITDDGEYSTEKTPMKLFYITLIVVASGTFVHYLLNWLINMDSSERNTVDYWTNDAMAATGQAALACLPLGIAIACIFSKNNKWIKLASWGVVAVVMLYNLVLAGRTLIVMLLATMVVAFLHSFKVQKKGRTRTLLIILAVVILILFVYQTDLLGIKSYIEDSLIYNRFFGGKDSIDVDEDQRMGRKLYHLSNIDKAFFGGAHIRDEIGFSHDIILDTYDEAGIFALFAILAYLAASAYHLVKCLKNQRFSFVFKQTVLCVYFTCYLEFMVEPILQGMPWFFASFCLIDGYVCRILSHDKTLTKRVV